MEFGLGKERGLKFLGLGNSLLACVRFLASNLYTLICTEGAVGLVAVWRKGRNTGVLSSQA